MTSRTEANKPSPIETATAAVLDTINAAISMHHVEHAVAEKQRIGEAEFRRILVLYFEQMTLRDWCEVLHIPDATDPNDRSDA